MGKGTYSSKSTQVVGCWCGTLTLCKPQTILILFGLGDMRALVSTMFDCRGADAPAHGFGWL